MKIIIVVLICLIIILPIFAMARTAGLADRRLEEIQRKAAERKAGDQIGD